MYEVDFTGWVRTPEELKKLKTDWKYSWCMNWRRFFKAIKYKRYWQLLKSAIKMSVIGKHLTFIEILHIFQHLFFRYKKWRYTRFNKKCICHKGERRKWNSKRICF